MDLLKILSLLQNSNIDILNLVKNFGSFLSPNQPQTKETSINNDIYQLPQYNTMPPEPQTQTASQSNFDINKIIEIAQMVLPLLNSKKEKEEKETSPPPATQSSQILKMTKIN